MFFEGSEKKIEIIVTQDTPSLRSLGRPFWQSMVSKANAEILSSVSNEYCDAYLLSESSLFVWDDHFLMLTCGTTTLVHAATLFIDTLGVEAIAFASYQRKNEYLAHLQASSFEDDLKLLREKISGKAYRFGHLDSHHHYIFYSDRPYAAEQGDITNELLMYHIGGETAQYLTSSRQTIDGVRQRLQLNQLLGDFAIDDFLFEPFGYSVNGIRGKDYFTIHVTPQEDTSYVSFETNLDLTKQNVDIFATLLHALAPGAWDVIGFNAAPMTQDYPAHVRLGQCSLTMEQGYALHFSHYQRCEHQYLQPTEL
ncbi:adenosylmethionine decarboxylase [Shewanella avicenniae]|uniref:Adenosylmethionine decarboxylase n=1 Tax=Shewanella avicenniae TaxID=2814294 RepID=A0ABX7QMY9_9GAMM|nr:adenosylmethionine decarboxylase [Shewanella avicenniae]QSX32078.1 adenosylmethionine decarboxylase [Shewanella avicenniae]